MNKSDTIPENVFLWTDILLISEGPANVNGLNKPIKRQRLAEWVKENDPFICYLSQLTSNIRNLVGWK